MKREWSLLDLDFFFKEYPELKRDDIQIGIDEMNKDKILSVIRQNSDRFKKILRTIMKNEYNNELYRKEDLSKKTSNIYAMRFRRSENIRIYCKEYKNGKKIIMMRWILKKSQKSQKIKNIIDNLGRYEYDL